MSFTAYSFAVFLLVVLLAYYAIANRRWQIRLLIVASYVFYGWWDWRFCGLILLSTVVDFTAARRLYAAPIGSLARRGWLATSLVVNLGALGFFKYFNFFVESAEAALQAAGYTGSTSSLAIVLPVGISFYTFQTLGYTIDVYRGQIAPVRRFELFALYVCYFPQLVAGPIERAERLLPQFEARRRVSAEQIAGGLWLLLLGFFKKLVLADSLAALADPVFDDPIGHASAVQMATYAFAFQIYFDFSGYSDIARGCSRLLGIELCVNFRQPYFSRNVAEFWRRWHVSLSSWLRDYLFIPLGGSRSGESTTLRNLMTVMLLGGLWHGASWTFVAWGGLHGAYLVAHQLLQRVSRPTLTPGWREGIATAMSVLITFHLVAITWVFFRAPDFATASAFFSRMLTPQSDWGTNGIVVGLAAVLAFALDWIPHRTGNDDYPLRWHWPRQAAVYSFLLLGLLFYGGQSAPFLYFQF